MRVSSIRPISFVIGLFAVLALLAAACGGDEEETAATNPPGGGGATATPAATAKIGGAGITSQKRDVKGLEGILTLDDSLAAWKTRPAGETRTGVTNDTIKIGRSSGITGAIAASEAATLPAYQALIKRINDAGGIHGRKIQFITRDDQYQPTVAIQTYKELVERDQVFALFGSPGTATHGAVAEYIRENKVLDFMYTAADFKNLYPTQRFVFAASDPHPKNGMVTAEAVLNVTPKAKVALISLSSIAGEWGGGFKAAIEKGGGQLVLNITYDAAAADLSAQAVQAANANPDWVVFAGPQTATFVRALREVAGYKGNVMWGAMTAGLPTSQTSQLLDGTVFIQTGDKDGLTVPDDPTVLIIKKVMEEDGVRWTGTQSSQVGHLQALIRALEIAGPDLTKEGFVEAAYLAFDGNWKCTLCTSPMIYTAEDHFLDQGALPMKWNHATQKYEQLGPLKVYETSKGTGIVGNVPGFECQGPSADHPKGTCPWKQ